MKKKREILRFDLSNGSIRYGNATPSHRIIMLITVFRSIIDNDAFSQVIFIYPDFKVIIRKLTCCHYQYNIEVIE